ncbi:hypothetical protein, partial [Lacisediminimonas sp.]|uniref:hypothetical protein n=1 Tax=Lacisediminimonas sp. TaxID=3060582 RepID=UPI00271D520F
MPPTSPRLLARQAGSGQSGHLSPTSPRTSSSRVLATTTTTANTATTTTSIVTSTTVATSPRAVAKKKEDSEKKNDSEKKGDGEKKRFGVRRAKTMQSMRPAENVDEKAKPAQAKVLVPTVLFDPAEAAKQVTKAESNSYKLPATRKQGMPVFRGAAFNKTENGKISVYATAWQPHAEVVFSRPEVLAIFEEVDESALGSKNLQSIIDGLNAQEAAKYNMPGIKAKPKE